MCSALNLCAGASPGTAGALTAHLELVSEPRILALPPWSCFLLSCLSDCVSVALLSGIHLFLFYLHPSLCLSGLPFITRSYRAMSSDTFPLLPASVCFHPLTLTTSLVFLSSSLSPGLSAFSYALF